MLIMIALTLAAVRDLGPAPDRLVRGGGPLRDRRARSRRHPRRPRGAAAGQADSGVGLGPVKAHAADRRPARSSLVSGVIAAAFWLAGRLGFGPLAPPLPPDVAVAAAARGAGARGLAAPRAGGLGLPVVWAGGLPRSCCPFAVYVISYLPWVALGNQLVPARGRRATTARRSSSSPSRCTTTTTTCARPHAASSPWWAWPLDLKPVWFYQGCFAGGTAASIYDAGNLVIWWLGIPAMVFVRLAGVPAPEPGARADRRSASRAQWLPWARIDRATFQYHYYTSVPFLLMALAYFLAELWHGPSQTHVARGAGGGRRGDPRAGAAVGRQGARCAASCGVRRSTRVRRHACGNPGRPRRDPARGAASSRARDRGVLLVYQLLRLGLGGIGEAADGAGPRGCRAPVRPSSLGRPRHRRSRRPGRRSAFAGRRVAAAVLSRGPRLPVEPIWRSCSAIPLG